MTGFSPLNINYINLDLFKGEIILL